MRCKGIYRTGRAISVAGEGREGGEREGLLLRAKVSSAGNAKQIGSERGK